MVEKRGIGENMEEEHGLCGSYSLNTHIVPGGGRRNATVPHYNTPHIPGLGSGVGGDQDSVPISVKFSYQMSLLHRLKSVSMYRVLFID